MTSAEARATDRRSEAARPSEPLRDPTFARLWTAQVVSSLGTEISGLAIPLIAVIALGAAPAGVALITAAGYLPSLILGLPAGSLADRGDQRRLLIVCDVIRGLVLLVIPIGWAAGWVTIPTLAAIVFVVGCGSVVFDVTLQTLTPRIVASERLIVGNARLQLGEQSAALVGPALGGVLVATVGAPLAVVADAASYFGSAVLIGGIRRPDRDDPSRTDGGQRRIGVTDGLRFVIGQPILRASAAASFAAGLGTRAVETLLVLALVRLGGLGPATVGLVFATGSVGFVVGAALADRWIGRFGIGRSATVALAVVGLTMLAMAGAPEAIFGLAIALAFFVHGVAAMTYNVASLSVRQAIPPRSLVGRVNAAIRVLSWASFPVGALLGGVIATSFGIRTAMVLAAAATLTGVLPLALSPIRRIVTLSDVAAPG